MLGVVSIDEALEKAADARLDLVEVSPQGDPPVCKLLDFGKYRYDSKKKVQQAKKKQKTSDLKEMKFRPNIGKHDIDVKLRHIRKFITTGEKVKISLRFRGREMAHQNIGMNIINSVIEQTSDIADTEVLPKMEGRQIIAVLVAKK